MNKKSSMGYNQKNLKRQTSVTSDATLFDFFKRLEIIMEKRENALKSV